MKCPYCGNELDTGFNCPKCKAKSYKEIVSEYNTNGEKIYEKNTIKLVQPDPTTAEMWEWLAENATKNQSTIFITNKLISVCTEIPYFPMLCTEETFKLDNGLHEAIKAAYAEAKKQEVEE